MSRAREIPSRLPALVVLAAVLSFAGCPKHLDFGPEGRIDRPRTLLQKMDEADAKLQALMGDGRLAIKSPQGSGEVAVFVAVQRPNLLHVETYDFFNRPTAVLVCNGQSFRLYDAANGRFYFGPATPENLARLLQAPLSAAQVVGTMLGSAPRNVNADPVLTVDEERGAYRILLRDGITRQTLWLDTLKLRPIRSERSGPPTATITEYGDFRPTAVGPVAREISISVPSAELKLRLRYTDVKFNQLEEGLFRVEAPEGVPQIELDGDGNPVSGEPRPEARFPLVQPPADPAAPSPQQ